MRKSSNKIIKYIFDLILRVCLICNVFGLVTYLCVTMVEVVRLCIVDYNNRFAAIILMVTIMTTSVIIGYSHVLLYHLIKRKLSKDV